ncbi:MAG: prepilin-type N-terminal cleavage/methylation domain-containing protein [Vampirovibrionales bacterium]|nr:prepilin-type N-terminal cleavage/methylation domain-containing protein [Vampirovibrionales bacterium]
MSLDRYRATAGFTLIEVAITVAIFATLAAITLKLSSSDVVNSSGEGAFQAARTFDQQTNSIYNLTSQYSAYSAYSSLPTTAGSSVRVPVAGRTAYTSNGETVYFTINLLNTAYRTDASGGLIGIDDAATVSGSAIRQIPNGAESYSAVLSLYQDAVGGTAYAVVPFSVIKNPCDAVASANCPSMGSTANSLEAFLEAYYPVTF